MLHQVGATVDSTSAFASEISTTTDQLATGAQEQSSQSDEVAAAVEEMSRSIVETAENARDTAEAAARSAELAQEGGRGVKETIEKIREIAGVVHEATETMQQLGRSSEAIGEIAAVIGEIADQTTLLALNAAIEAARAGEHEQGFCGGDRRGTPTRRAHDIVNRRNCRDHRAMQEANETVGTSEAGTTHVEKSMKMTDKPIPRGARADRGLDRKDQRPRGTDHLGPTKSSRQPASRFSATSKPPRRPLSSRPRASPDRPLGLHPEAADSRFTPVYWPVPITRPIEQRRRRARQRKSSRVCSFRRGSQR